MKGWERSEEETREIQAEAGCPVDACIYHQGDLRALVLYVDRDGQGMRWHLYLASAVRMPEPDELLAARQALLPGIERFDYEPDEETGPNCIHLWELSPGRLQ